MHASHKSVLFISGVNFNHSFILLMATTLRENFCLIDKVSYIWKTNNISPPEIIFFGCFPDHDDSDGNYLDSDCIPL